MWWAVRSPVASAFPTHLPCPPQPALSLFSAPPSFCVPVISVSLRFPLSLHLVLSLLLLSVFWPPPQPHLTWVSLSPVLSHTASLPLPWLSSRSLPPTPSPSRPVRGSVSQYLPVLLFLFSPSPLLPKCSLRPSLPVIVLHLSILLSLLSPPPPPAPHRGVVRLVCPPAMVCRTPEDQGRGRWAPVADYKPGPGSHAQLR